MGIPLGWAAQTFRKIKKIKKFSKTN